MQMQPSSITFLTDVEGDGIYFDRFVRHSTILTFRPVAPSFGKYGDNGGKDWSANENDEVRWNLGECDEDYFPYDKEVVFIDDDEENDRENCESMLVYGVSLLSRNC